MLSVQSRLYILGRKLLRNIRVRLSRFKPRELVELESKRSDRRLRPSERIVEYHFIFEKMEGGKEKNQKVLDVGCAESTLTTELAALGYEAYGMDARIWPIKRIKNAFSICGDICKAPFRDNSFEVVIAISTIEHIGVEGSYGLIKEDREGDAKAVKEMARLVKPGGRVFVTVPYGIMGVGSWQRIYNHNTLMRLLPRLRIRDIRYYAQAKDSWLPVSRSVADEIESNGHARAVLLLELTKDQ